MVWRTCLKSGDEFVCWISPHCRGEREAENRVDGCYWWPRHGGKYKRKRDAANRSFVTARKQWSLTDGPFEKDLQKRIHSLIQRPIVFGIYVYIYKKKRRITSRIHSARLADSSKTTRTINGRIDTWSMNMSITSNGQGVRVTLKVEFFKYVAVSGNCVEKETRGESEKVFVRLRATIETRDILSRGIKTSAKVVRSWRFYLCSI